MARKSLADLSAQWEPPERPPRQQQPAPERPEAPRGASRQGARRKRSIYLNEGIAADYDEALWSLHAKHRADKGSVQDALLRVALDHLDEVDGHLDAS